MLLYFIVAYILDQVLFCASNLFRRSNHHWDLFAHAKVFVVCGWFYRLWDDLDSFLSKYDTPTINSSSAASSSNTNKSTALKLPVLEEDRFQLSVGKLLLSLQKKDRFTFDSVMDTARAQVIFFGILCKFCAISGVVRIDSTL